jgi:hypothetical protein
MGARGVKNIINTDFFSYDAGKYDTLLLLMNGIGLCGELGHLDNFFARCAALLNPNGCVLFDSSDISYLYDDIPLPADKYFGQISYCYEYKEVKGNWFDWLYIDQITLKSAAEKNGWKADIIYEDDQGQYLAVLKRNKSF